MGVVMGAGSIFSVITESESVCGCGYGGWKYF